MPNKAGGKGRSISKKDYKILKQIFASYDRDESGTVTYAEFLKAFDVYEGKESGAGGPVLSKSAAGMFNQLDTNHDGLMNFKELLMAYYPYCTPNDIDKFITMYDPEPPEVLRERKMLTEEQEEELEGVMKLFDADGVLAWVQPR
eukprot:TRINITY_DN676_c0_g1_i7.p1 TRINITY_DN676_c0_g1~~TRINITY_DN676_c0_g1_i7.p1  ORF type:complete len:145 (+),score=49.98 TRINITY_DN676_c0_g1_i7:182-616(+)